MLMTNTMVRPKQPSLKVREGNVNHRKVSICSFRVAIKHQRFVLVTQGGQIIVAHPSICTDYRSFRHIIFHKFREVAGTTAWNKAHSQSSGDDFSSGFAIPAFGFSFLAYLDGSNDSRLVVDATSFTPCTSADKCFINLYRIQSPDSIARGSHQTATELVEHLKRSFISGQPQLSLKLERRLPWRLRRHEVSPPKPNRQWRVTGLHDGPRRERHVGFAGAASQNDRCSLGKTVGCFTISAFRTDKTVRPSQMFKVSCAGGIIGKSTLKFGKRCRKATRIHFGNLASDLVIGKQPDRQGLFYL